MQNKTRTQEISALGHLVIKNSSGSVNDNKNTTYYEHVCELSI